MLATALIHYSNRSSLRQGQYSPPKICQHRDDDSSGRILYVSQTAHHTLLCQGQIDHDTCKEMWGTGHE